MPSSAHLFDCSGTSVCSSVCHSNETRDWCAAAVCSQLLAAAVCCSGLFAAACCSGLFAAACLRMRNRCTSLNHDRLMRLPSHICTSVRSLQPTHVRPSLQHMCVHRFASRIHLHNTGLGCEQRMRRAFFRSTLLALQSVHCSPRCPSIAVAHVRVHVHLFAARMHSRRRVWVRATRVRSPACQNHRSNHRSNEQHGKNSPGTK